MMKAWRETRRWRGRGWGVAWVMALALSGCISEALAQEFCINGRTPTGQKCGEKKRASKKARKKKACEPGKVRNTDTRGHCCYPGQAWVSSRQQCVGTPTSCPEGLQARARAQTCVPEDVPEGMVRVPAGKFRMGSTSGFDEEPVHEVYVSEFFIDTYEVTVAEYQACMNAGACSRPQKTHEDRSSYNHGASGRARHPINGVNWSQAKAYCEWAGKRLPTEAEWEKAARGTDGRTYPWGNKKPSCRRAVTYGDDIGGCGRRRTWPVGSKPAGVSPYGAHDMAGNVSEWTSDWYDRGAYESSSSRDPTGPVRGSLRVFRGGGWNDVSNLRGAWRGSHRPDFAYYNLGLRCVRSLN